MSRRDQMLERISIDPKVCFGKPVIKGTRIWVSLILDFLASGDCIDTILQEYPHLTREDIEEHLRQYLAVTKVIWLDRGVYLAPSQFEAGFISTSHSDADIQHTVDAMKEFFEAA